MVVMVDCSYDNFETSFRTNQEECTFLKRVDGEYVRFDMTRLSFGVLHRRCEAPPINLGTLGQFLRAFKSNKSSYEN